MTREELYKIIGIMRIKLYDLIDRYGIGSDIVLSFSQELDKLLYRYQNMNEH